MKYIILSLLITLSPLNLIVHAKDITMKGSDTMIILAQKWSEVYMNKFPNQKIQVNGGGSGTGFTALQNNTTDICNASRKIKAKEIEQCIKVFNKRPNEYKVALDGISIYVNESNPINSLSLDELQSIFTGKIKNWKDIGGPNSPITLYSRENSSGTYEFFKEHVLKGSDFSPNAQPLPGTAAVLLAVTKDKNSIGYGGAAYGKGAKILKISQDKNSTPILPSEETVLNGSYPIWRYLYIYVSKDNDKNEISTFINWIRSNDGQTLVKSVGYYPIPNTLRSN